MKWFRSIFVMLMMLALSGPAQAEIGPEQVVRETTDRMMGMLKDQRELYNSDPEALYKALDELLSPVIAFDAIAKSVVSVKYNRDASPEQMQNFEVVFKRSLVEFYGKAISQFDDSEFNIDIVVKPVDPKKMKKRRVPVEMDVTTANGTLIPLTYTMFKAKDGTWKLRNVIVNGINIGKLFRTQFDQAMQDNGKDLQYVIDNWGEILSQNNQPQSS
ncbi:ABC transporter substrate-binding protein [Aestuariirhabdus sp. Z084]|uniref:MlaC/ttg2D family ABC transporter substrate-binding protein n=1 Tax=Aestuariirhabdus haliotis TaxID=2918751 RepID=UPI00201B446E|nr:ABC transporter substrate-binding protein [Aestuariirhabdus haliotis]MCL6415237.1 ABC transporter substrate-binding protein [Aestuariirhabdus haliotis]MCL6419497.1 ABC transporter substrate-binding protein [Aestuariirhabdus haliotis]